MSDILNIGASGVRAYQTAITTVSENIANSGVEGYSRRSTSLSEVSPASTTITRREVTSAGGVIATGIARAGDPLKEAEVRATGADVARSDGAVTWLDRIQTALTGNQLSSRITSFFTAATGVAADPSASGARTTMIEAAGNVAGAFTATGAALGQVGADLDATAATSAEALNGLAASLARTNDALSRNVPNTNASAQLLDQRDQILEKMSAIADISVTTDDAGRATVRVGGGSGPVLVAGNNAGSLSYARGTGGAVSFAVHFGGDIITAQISGGSLAGLAEGAERLAEAQTTLDGIASDFVDGVNAVQAQGRDLDGNPGAAMFAVGASPTEVARALDDPRGIAAAAPGGGRLDNSNLVNLTALRGSGGFEGGVTGLVSSNAAALAAKKAVAEAQGSIHDNAIAARDMVSGVTLDAEAVDLLRFQQAYSASSRVIQAARDIFQSIIEIR